jgi:phosphopantothenoylcysteine decarboxylase/phosphopantothenate--cysteine ligase
MKTEHPSKDIIGSLNTTLKGKKIILCVTGSVAAIKAPEIARILMRSGSEVYTVMSNAAQRIIHPDLMHWATGNSVVTELTGAIEHISLAGNVSGRADIVLIAPSTANTLGKIACGIDDTPVTTVVTTAIGEGLPIIIIPAMHESMYNHPVVQENIKQCKKIGIEVLEPLVEEGKAKIPETDEIVRYVIAKLSQEKKLKNLNVLITAGATIEYIDPVRIITNKSSGKMGMAIASEVQREGAHVTVIYGRGTAKSPYGVELLEVETAQEMREAVYEQLKTKKIDVVIAAAAVGDWTVKHRSDKKVSTHDHDSLSLELIPTPKIIDIIKGKNPDIFLVCFRAVTGLSNDEMIENAFKRLVKADADIIVANDVMRKGAGFDGDTNEVFIIDKKKKVTYVPLSHKNAVAAKIVEVIALSLKKKK